MNEYEQLVQQVEKTLAEEKVPFGIKEQFLELHHIAKKMLKDYYEEKSLELYEGLSEAIEKKEYTKQWYIIENLRKSDSKPTPALINYLSQEDIHPIVKTAIFKWLQDLNLDDNVTIIKMGIQLTVKPSNVVDIKEDITFRQVMLCIRDIEQENPTL